MTAAARFDRRARWAGRAAAASLLLSLTALWSPVPHALSLALYVAGAVGTICTLSAAALWSARADLARWDARTDLRHRARRTVAFDHLDRMIERAEAARRGGSV